MNLPVAISKADVPCQAAWSRAANAIQITRQRANVRRDRHFVVVQQNYHPLLEVSDLIDSLQRHSRRQPRVADKRDHVEVFALQVTRGSDAERRRDRRPGMSRIEHVVLGLLAPQEPAQPFVLSYRRKLLAAAS